MSGSYSYKMELRACEACGGEYMGGRKSHYCPDCRRRKQAESARAYQEMCMARGGEQSGMRQPGGAYSSPRVCRRCGRDFWGYTTARLCPDCKEAVGRERPGPQDAGRELADEKTGWRNMLRDATGTVIVPGGNVMTALDDLCSYEEACQALGVEGPEQLRNLLSHVATLMPQEVIRRCAQKGRRPEPRKREASSAVRVEYGCRCCGSCGHFVPDSSTGKGTAGHCAIHPKMIRSGGGKKGRLVEVPGEFRKCFGAREACKDWARREDEDPTTASRQSPSPASRGGFDGGQIARATGEGRQIAGATGGVMDAG